MLSPRSAIEFGRSGRIVYREVSTRVVPAIDTRDWLSAFRVARVLLKTPEG